MDAGGIRVFFRHAHRFGHPLNSVLIFLDSCLPRNDGLLWKKLPDCSDNQLQSAIIKKDRIPSLVISHFSFVNYKILRFMHYSLAIPNQFHQLPALFFHPSRFFIIILMVIAK